jgi:arylsulfatase A-like enzyme
MEAHIPYIPPRELRERMLAPEQIDLSYAIDNSPLPRWAFNFGLREYDAEQLEIIGAVYDATLLELDGLLERLLADLESRGLLENTIVVLASDHGEHLGEHHLLDHQYSMYDPVLRVPLIVHYPRAFAAGRESGPVMSFDLFPTLLELAGIAAPADVESKAVSLLRPRNGRLRMAEYPQPFGPAIESIHRDVDPDWDATPWLRRMRALFRGPHKLICSTDGRHELYDRTVDPEEARDLYAAESDLAGELMGDLVGLGATLFDPGFRGDATPSHTAEELRMLEGLGYVGAGGDTSELEAPESDLCGF